MFTQTHRLLSLATPLEIDELLLESFEGVEELSRPFEFHLDMISPRGGITAAELVGKGVAFRVDREGSEPRVFHGVVERFTRAGSHESGIRRYKAVVVPRLSLLKKRSNCRIFQDRSIIEIVGTVLEEAGVRDFETHNLLGDDPKVEYCVQYNETDFDFVSRLLEESGIFYFFRHEADRHVLVLADNKAAYADCAQRRVEYSEGTLVVDHIHRWDHQFVFVSGRWAQTDFDFKSPELNLLSDTPTVVGVGAIQGFERYEYPGRYGTRAHGKARVQQRMEAEEASHELVEGSSTCQSFQLASRFRLVEHLYDVEEAKYVITALRHSARDSSYEPNASGDSYYRNDFRCIPADVIFRPQRTTPVPRVLGPQTAVVVGPEGEEIFTDSHGRVKVHFHWDRHGKGDESSSCWIRVAQPWAGANFGGLVLPRVGHEVVVEFLDGDPDRPLINGSVFNGSNPPPQNLPADRANMTLRSNSLGGAGGSNEITMTDSGGSEGFYIHAQYDLNEVVENDRSKSVGNNETVQVGVDRTTQVGNNDARTVAVDDLLDVGTNATESVGADKTVKVGANLILDAGSSITLRCGSASITLSSAGVINISGSMVNITGSVNANVTAPLTNVTGAAMATLNGAVALVNGGVTRITGTSLAHIGGAKVETVASGDNLVQGGTVKLN